MKFTKWLLLVLLSVSLYAQSDDKFKIDAGAMFITTMETNIQFGKEGVPLGAKINTKDQLGMNNDDSAFRIDGYYRFDDIHSINFAYYAVRSKGKRFVEREFDWNGNTLFNVNTSSHFNMDIIKVNYGYSFYHNDRVELQLLAGLHVTNIDVGLNAFGTVNGEESIKQVSGTSVPVPLPVFGFKGEYTIIPNELYVTYKAEYFYLKFDFFKGLFVNSMINLEYRFMDDFGIGIGLNNSTLEVELETSDKKLNVENKLGGISTYLTYRY